MLITSFVSQRVSNGSLESDTDLSKIQDLQNALEKQVRTVRMLLPMHFYVRMTNAHAVINHVISIQGCRAEQCSKESE